MSDSKYSIQKSATEWQEELTPEEYRILREKGTEQPFSGKYNSHFEKGSYVCKACKQKLFESSSKFESNCGWPSYDSAVAGAIEYIEDRSHGMMRVEIVCSQCGSHQGHVFDDGPTDTGIRYCVNAASLSFVGEK